MNELEEIELKELLQRSNKFLEKLAEENKAMKPKAEIYDHLVDDGHCENATDLFKKIKLLKGKKEVTRNTAYKFLRDIKVFRNDNTPYIEYAKYFKLVTKPNKAGIYNTIPLFTMKGIEYFIKKVDELGYVYNLRIEYRINNNE